MERCRELQPVFVSMRLCLNNVCIKRETRTYIAFLGFSLEYLASYKGSLKISLHLRSTRSTYNLILIVVLCVFF